MTNEEFQAALPRPTSGGLRLTFLRSASLIEAAVVVDYLLRQALIDFPCDQEGDLGRGLFDRIHRKGFSLPDDAGSSIVVIPTGTVRIIGSETLSDLAPYLAKVEPVILLR